MTKLTLRRPTPLFNELLNEFDFAPNRLRRLFEAENLLEPVGWMPAVEIEEKGNELILTAELPGLKKENVNVAFEDGVLTISGEKVEEREEKDKDRKLHMWERNYGTFRRAFTLPKAIDPAKIVAEFNRGILMVRMPKSVETAIRGRKIEVAETR